jgi:hypothetical protein
MQATDLCPVIHVDHVLAPWPTVQSRFAIQHEKWWIAGKRGQSSAGDRGGGFKGSGITVTALPGLSLESILELDA